MWLADDWGGLYQIFTKRNMPFKRTGTEFLNHEYLVDHCFRRRSTYLG